MRRRRFCWRGGGEKKSTIKQKKRWSDATMTSWCGSVRSPRSGTNVSTRLYLYTQSCQVPSQNVDTEFMDWVTFLSYCEVTKLFWWSVNTVVVSLLSLRTAASHVSTDLFRQMSGVATLWLRFFIFFFVDGVKWIDSLVWEKICGKTWLDVVDRSSVQTASSSDSTVLTFCTDDVILCMRDFVFCVWALVSAGFWRLRLPCCFPALRWLDLCWPWPSSLPEKPSARHVLTKECHLWYSVTFDLSCLSQRLQKLFTVRRM